MEEDGEDEVVGEVEEVVAVEVDEGSLRVREERPILEVEEWTTPVPLLWVTTTALGRTRPMLVLREGMARRALGLRLGWALRMSYVPLSDDDWEAQEEDAEDAPLVAFLTAALVVEVVVVMLMGALAVVVVLEVELVALLSVMMVVNLVVVAVVVVVVVVVVVTPPPPLPSASEMGMAGKHSLSRSDKGECG